MRCGEEEETDEGVAEEDDGELLVGSGFCRLLMSSSILCVRLCKVSLSERVSLEIASSKRSELALDRVESAILLSTRAPENDTKTSFGLEGPDPPKRSNRKDNIAFH